MQGLSNAAVQALQKEVNKKKLAHAVGVGMEKEAVIKLLKSMASKASPKGVDEWAALITGGVLGGPIPGTSVAALAGYRAAKNAISKSLKLTSSPAKGVVKPVSGRQLFVGVDKETGRQMTISQQDLAQALRDAMRKKSQNLGKDLLQPRSILGG
jgi:hypothetical protein